MQNLCFNIYLIFEIFVDLIFDSWLVNHNHLFVYINSFQIPTIKFGSIDFDFQELETTISNRLDMRDENHSNKRGLGFFQICRIVDSGTSSAF